MRKFQRIVWVGLIDTLLFACSPFTALAIATPPAMSTPTGLSFAELKITGDEFIVLQNNSGNTISDLSSYWIQNFNNVNPLAAGVSNSSQQLPQVSLTNGQTLLLSSVAMPTCGASVAGKLNISLTDGGGFMEIVQMGQNSNGAVTQTPGDVVSWSSTTSGIIQNVPSSTKDPKAAYYRYQSGTSYAWQIADIDATNTCQLNVVTQSGTTAQPVSTNTLSKATTSPPATIISLSDGQSSDSVAGATLPPSDIGLVAPQLTELVPNPSGTGTDASDEYIELYNPNGTDFDLTGFMLQVGTTTTHKYTFPEGTSLPSKAFVAFYSDDSGLSMSNSGGQAVLLDPFGTQIGSSDAYGTAKDGQAWALANGKWYWTTTPTPNAANVINQPATSKKTATGSSGKKSIGGSVKGASTKANTSSSGSSGAALDGAQVTPIHPWTLATVAGAALLYGAYEYRVDMANRIHQFRTNRAARRAARA